MKMERSPKNAVITVARSLGILMLVIGLQGGLRPIHRTMTTRITPKRIRGRSTVVWPIPAPS
jgi:hypothetical protein